MSHRFLRAALVVGVAAAAVEPFLFAGSFAGDAQVHLVFAENASRGRFFEFNRGERVSGETSPGYMLLEAALFRVLPPPAVPVAVKVLNLAAWYLFCLLVYRVASRRLNEPGQRVERTPAAVAALTAALVPGSAYNANVGMESGLFAALLWVWIDRAVAWEWFSFRREAPRTRQWGREVALAATLGISCWFRPEGLVILPLAYGYQLWSAHPKFNRWVIGAAIACVVGIGAFAFESACTGDVIPTSVLSRRLLSMHRALDLGHLRIDPAFGERLLILLPLTAYFGMDVRRTRLRSTTDLFLFVAFATFFIIYTFITGGAQLSRYIIFLTPILAIGAVRQACCEWNSGQSRRRIAVVVAGVLFISTNVVESIYRATSFSREALVQAMTAPSRRTAASDEMLRSLGYPGKRPVILALEPIQVRYELDDRFVVRSVDGRIDRALVQFANREYIDHLGYLVASDIDYFYAPNDYDHTRPSWAVSMLNGLAPGQAASRGSLTFEMLPSRAIAVHRGWDRQNATPR